MTISTAQARPAGRREWIDATKGLAIILVVMWHVEFWHYEVTRAWPPYLFPVIDLLKEVWMPLFFFISGYLIKGLLFRDGVKSWIRAGNLFFVYLFWGALVSLKQLLLLDDGFWEFAYRIALLVVSPSSFWYFWALAVFTLIARLAMSGGRWGLGILIGLSVAAYLFGQPYAISLDHTMRGVNIDSHFRGFVMNAIFFNMGVVMSIYASGKDQAGSRNSRILAALVAASGGLLIYTSGTSLPAATLVMGGLFVLAVMSSIASVAFGAGPVSSVLGALGTEQRIHPHLPPSLFHRSILHHAKAGAVAARRPRLDRSVGPRQHCHRALRRAGLPVHPQPDGLAVFALKPLSGTQGVTASFSTQSGLITS